MKKFYRIRKLLRTGALALAILPGMISSEAEAQQWVKRSLNTPLSVNLQNCDLRLRLDYLLHSSDGTTNPMVQLFSFEGGSEYSYRGNKFQNLYFSTNYDYGVAFLLAGGNVEALTFQQAMEVRNDFEESAKTPTDLGFELRLRSDGTPVLEFHYDKVIPGPLVDGKVFDIKRDRFSLDERCFTAGGTPPIPAATPTPIPPAGGSIERFIDETYELYFSGSDDLNWAGLSEKWLPGKDGRWFYIIPDGTVYEWIGADRTQVSRDSRKIGKVSPAAYLNTALLYDAG